ncbi:MAG: SpoIIIAH-like family protein [Peptococcaceae bacterium]|nr:SpoIIIAH-like family protein [Peptococcaceae bacterium]
MNEFVHAVRAAIGVICMGLLAMGVIGNLFFTTLPEQEAAMLTAGQAQETAADWEQQYTEEQMQAAAETALFTEDRIDTETAEETATLENQIAALRMERDSSWQQLKDGLNHLQFEEKQQWLRQYELLQYKEQRLELLLQAKGIQHCLVVLEEQQANVIVAQSELAEQYEKIYDLVKRNTDYGTDQIILVPLKTEKEQI